MKPGLAGKDSINNIIGVGIGVLDLGIIKSILAKAVLGKTVIISSSLGSMNSWH